jgi:hypothetical protein
VVELVPEVDVVAVVDVPVVDVPFVDVVAVFVTGGPVPVSVAVVPVDVGWSVSVDPVVVSAGSRLHATHRPRMAMMVMTRRMRMSSSLRRPAEQSSRPVGARREGQLRRR